MPALCYPRPGGQQPDRTGDSAQPLQPLPQLHQRCVASFCFDFLPASTWDLNRGLNKCAGIDAGVNGQVAVVGLITPSGTCPNSRCIPVLLEQYETDFAHSFYSQLVQPSSSGADCDRPQASALSPCGPSDGVSSIAIITLPTVQWEPLFMASTSFFDAWQQFASSTASLASDQCLQARPECCCHLTAAEALQCLSCMLV